MSVLISPLLNFVIFKLALAENIILIHESMNSFVLAMHDLEIATAELRPSWIDTDSDGFDEYAEEHCFDSDLATNCRPAKDQQSNRVKLHGYGFILFKYGSGSGVFVINAMVTTQIT